MKSLINGNVDPFLNTSKLEGCVQPQYPQASHEETEVGRTLEPRNLRTSWAT